MTTKGAATLPDLAQRIDQHCQRVEAALANTKGKRTPKPPAPTDQPPPGPPLILPPLTFVDESLVTKTRRGAPKSSPVPFSTPPTSAIPRPRRARWPLDVMAAFGGE